MTRLSGVSADTKDELRQTVERSAAFLDDADRHVIPENWRDLLDVDPLNMADPNRCVLGQLGAVRGEQLAYQEMAEVLGLELGTDEMEHLGFERFSGSGLSYPALTLAWKQYLTKCRAG